MKILFLLILFFASSTYAQDLSESQCKPAIRSTRRICRGTFITTQIMALLKALEAYKGAKRLLEACQEAQQISQISYTGNFAFALICEKSIRHCKRACRDDNKISICEDFEDQVKLATIQAISNAQTFIHSKSCVNATLDKCDTCGTSGGIGSTLPEDINNNFTPQNSNHLLELTDEQPPSDYDFEPKELTNKNSHVNASETNSSNFNIGSEKSIPIDSPHEISNSEMLDKDILQGSNTAPAGLVGTSNPIEETNASDLTNKQTDTINLKDFLPGAPKYHARTSSVLGNPELTPANGLSNFQKITRKINEKRSELIP